MHIRQRGREAVPRSQFAVGSNPLDEYAGKFMPYELDFDKRGNSMYRSVLTTGYFYKYHRHQYYDIIYLY